MISLALTINFVCHILIFIGALYIAVYNEKLPIWHKTPLWYAGLSCLLTAITIILGGFFGQDFPMSYANIGVVGETALNICLAYIAVHFIIDTVRQKYPALFALFKK